MGYMGATNMISQGLMKMISSVSFVAAETGRNGMTTFLMTIGEVLNDILTFMAQIVYFVAKWVLYFTDIMFFYIKQLAGLDMDTSSLNKMISRESDMALNFLLSNGSLLTQIIKSLIGLAVILIIIFSIIAIIKNQYQ